MAALPVSVVIPTFNSAHLISQAVESVLLQSSPPAEILVIDDGSVDDTRQRLLPYTGRVGYLHQPNRGVSAARNLGVLQASQEFVAFLDADDVWHPRKLELQMKAFERCPELGLLSTREFAWPAPEFPEVQERTTGVKFVDWSQLVVRNYLATSAIVARRSALLLAGPFYPAIQGPEDRDLWLRVAERTRVAILEMPLTGYRDVPGSVSKQGTRCQQGMLRILHKLDERGVWGHRWLLRRKAYSYVYHSCAFIHAAAGHYPTALACSLKSLLWYPLLYRRAEVSCV